MHVQAAAAAAVAAAALWLGNSGCIQQVLPLAESADLKKST
jgi:hypothetical protein